MPSDNWTKQELDTLLRAIKSVRIPVDAKRAIASEVRKQCMGGHGIDFDMMKSILGKLGYDELPPRESEQDE
jgi:hypothetical protein